MQLLGGRAEADGEAEISADPKAPLHLPPLIKKAGHFREPDRQVHQGQCGRGPCLVRQSARAKPVLSPESAGGYEGSEQAAADLLLSGMHRIELTCAWGLWKASTSRSSLLRFPDRGT
jgi:hypothetical protein